MARPPRRKFYPRLAEFRRYVGLTQEQVAERIGVTAEMIRRHERGISHPIEKYRKRYSLLYDATEVELGIGLVRPPLNRSLVHGAQGSDEHNPAFSLSVPMVPEYLSDHDDTNCLELIRGYIDQIIALDNRFGGAELMKLSQRFFRAIHDRLGAGAYCSSIKKDILAAAGELAELTGWLAFDADQQQVARQMNQESLYFTRLAGDKKMELLTLQNSSMQAGFLKRPYEELCIAESVLNGDYCLSPRLRALFLARKARALAQGGDESAVKIFDEIRSLYLEGTRETDPNWAWWVDERELAWHEAMCRQDLGDKKLAIGYFEKSVEATPLTEVRSQYLHRAYLLGAQLDLGSWSAAGDTMQQLFPLVVEVASTRTVVLLQKILMKLKDSERNTPARILDEVEQLMLALDGARV